jgi:hypothetical protein
LLRPLAAATGKQARKDAQMSRYLKILGLALVVVYAMSAVMASAVMANKEFKSPQSTTTTFLTGEAHAGNDIVNFDAGELTCSNVTYKGSFVGTSTPTVTLEPAYTGCHTIFIFTFNTTVDTNGCAFVFSIEAGANANNEGEVEIECPNGMVIQVTAPGCTKTIPPQSGLKKVTYTNKGNAVPVKEMDLTFDIALTGITYEEHNIPPANTCPSDTVHTTNGTYSGAATVRGYSSLSTHNSTTQTGITVE